MNASEDYCELCDLPRSQCIHGRPPTPPAPAVKPVKAAKASTAPRKRTTTASRTPGAPAKPVVRRWTPPEEFKPLILSVLEEAGGELEADEVFLELEILMEDRFRAGDNETTPEGELRWRYAARRARIALIEEGLIAKARPGVWQLATPRRDRS
ncbi:hypothetical protein [Nocardioides pocheonensis]|jgi:hypothetical protein|uniref:Restriction system protein Mrr-like N-terminal domain-containing protein n=1 Tax=Nocardioides pocheonensis TaxID=661485 RepID=A0A3N0GLT5_9ACTN|nr:hypothetical protein [Nocardioides pocheonensis]RNM13166.1 hypothetical protein EFL26_16480 [Nocardioides pocheonensis]